MNTQNRAPQTPTCAAPLRWKMTLGSLTVHSGPRGKRPEADQIPREQRTLRSEGNLSWTSGQMFKFALENELQVESQVHCLTNTRNTLEF